MKPFGTRSNRSRASDDQLKSSAFNEAPKLRMSPGIPSLFPLPSPLSSFFIFSLRIFSRNAKETVSTCCTRAFFSTLACAFLLKWPLGKLLSRSKASWVQDTRTSSKVVNVVDSCDSSSVALISSIFTGSNLSSPASQTLHLTTSPL